MMFIKNKFNLGNEIVFVALMGLIFAPNGYKLPGLVIFCFSLIIAAVIDSKKNTKRVRRMTRKVASCGCERAKEKISHMHMPKMLQLNCTVCGAEAI